MFFCIQLQEPNLQQWPVRQIEVRLGVVVDPLLYGGGLFMCWNCARDRRGDSNGLAGAMT